MSSCPICLETISSTKAKPDVCDHLFCLQCLTKWSKMESFCPVDRKRFRKIINLDTGTSCEIKRRGRKRKSRTLYEVTTFCEVCKSGEKDDTLLLCDSCDLAYHCECLSPPLSAVPSGRWFCPICSSIDRRLEHGEELSKKPREESAQPFFQTSSCSTQASLEAVKSSSNNFTKHPFNLRKNANRGHSSGMVQSLSFPSSSSSGQLNSVKISKEDYQTLCAHSKSLFLAPGITVSPNRRKVQEFTIKTTPLASLSNESCKISPSACDSSEHLMANSAVKLGVFNLPEKKNAESDLKKKGSNQNSRSFETSGIIYQSAVSQLKGKDTFTYKSSKTSNLLTSCSDFDKYKNHSKNQLSNVSVVETHLLSEKEKQKRDSFEGILEVPEEIRYSDDSSDCEIVFDGSNCITISDNLRSREFEQIPKISSVTSQAEQNSRENSSDNQSVTLSKPASPNIGCLKDGTVTETIIDHVSETEDEDDLPNPLDDFEIRSSYYAAKAKRNLPRELKKIEEEYRNLLTPHKRARTSTGASSSNLLEDPQAKQQELERTSAPNSKQVFNIIDYTRRVKKGKHLHTSCEILNKYRAFVARNAEKSKSKPNFESGHDLNVFQGPFSQHSFGHGGTKMRFMRFNPSDIPKDVKTYPTMLHRDFQDLSMREDGSLFMKWSMKC